MQQKLCWCVCEKGPIFIGIIFCKNHAHTTLVCSIQTREEIATALVLKNRQTKYAVIMIFFHSWSQNNPAGGSIGQKTLISKGSQPAYTSQQICSYLKKITKTLLHSCSYHPATTTYLWNKSLLIWYIDESPLWLAQVCPEWKNKHAPEWNYLTIYNPLTITWLLA